MLAIHFTESLNFRINYTFFEGEFFGLRHQTPAICSSFSVPNPGMTRLDPCHCDMSFVHLKENRENQIGQDRLNSLS